MRNKLLLGLVTSVLLFTGFASAEDNTSNTINNPASLYASEIAQAEELGRLIYEKDIAAWTATDQLLIDLGDDLSGLPLRGWVTDEDEHHYRVNFIGEQDGETKIYYQAWTQGKSVIKAKTYPQGIALNPKQSSMWRARKLVSQQKFMQCASRYNTVVIPYDDAGIAKIYVYLFASTTDPNKIMIGGHHRYSVSSDGTEVLANISFSNSCLQLNNHPDAIAMVVSHVKTNYPQEHHVFASLSHGITLYVMIPATDILYMIENGKITVVRAGRR
jgi:hypothetical protein